MALLSPGGAHQGNVLPNACSLMRPPGLSKALTNRREIHDYGMKRGDGFSLEASVLQLTSVVTVVAVVRRQGLVVSFELATVFALLVLLLVHQGRLMLKMENFARQARQFLISDGLQQLYLLSVQADAQGVLFLVGCCYGCKKQLRSSLLVLHSKRLLILCYLVSL